MIIVEGLGNSAHADVFCGDVDQVPDRLQCISARQSLLVDEHLQILKASPFPRFACATTAVLASPLCESWATTIRLSILSLYVFCKHSFYPFFRLLQSRSFTSASEFRRLLHDVHHFVLIPLFCHDEHVMKHGTCRDDSCR